VTSRSSGDACETSKEEEEEKETGRLNLPGRRISLSGRERRSRREGGREEPSASQAIMIQKRKLRSYRIVGSTRLTREREGESAREYVRTCEERELSQAYVYFSLANAEERGREGETQSGPLLQKYI